MTEQTNIKVAIRVRPYSRYELETSQRPVVHVVDERTLLFDPGEEQDDFYFQGVRQFNRDITKRVNKNMSMEFDRVFNIDTTNEEIFQECTAPLINGVLQGYNCSVFVYGATGAGKTYTMLGNQHMLGLTFLTMQYLFERISSQHHSRKFDVGVSYLEVYNEQVKNLLSKSAPLKLMEDNSGGVVVNGLQLIPITNADQLLNLLVSGNSHRTQHPTDANAESSRSHAIFQVHIRITEKDTGSKRTVKLSMIDLAGSERAASTRGVGARFKEGACINKSLLALGNCINKLADGLKHIPYRDSNLTRILKDSLGGNCQTLMVANVSMSSLNYEDTYNTLKYASRAKKIRSNLKQNIVKNNMPKDYYVRKLNEMSAELQALKSQHKKPKAVDDEELVEWRNKIDKFYKTYTEIQNESIFVKRDLKMAYFRDKLQSNNQEIKSLLNTGSRTNGCSTKEKLSRLHEEKKEQSEKLKQLEAELVQAQNEFEILKDEINEINSSELSMYLQIKELHLKDDKLKLTAKHLTSITHEMAIYFEKLSNSFKLSCELLHSERYRLMNNCKFEELQKLINGPNLDNNSSTVATQTVIGAYFPNIPRRMAEKKKYDVDSDECSSGNAAANKTQIVENETSNLNVEKPTVSNINNITVCLSPRTEASQIVHDIISQDLLKAPENHRELNMALLKSKKRICGIPKENKRYSGNRISKSPRIRKIMTKATSSSEPIRVTYPRRPFVTSNNRNNNYNKVHESHEETVPLVRINRASALRCRK